MTPTAITSPVGGVIILFVQGTVLALSCSVLALAESEREIAVELGRPMTTLPVLFLWMSSPKV